MIPEALHDALRQYVMSANKLHADDTPVPVLAPGTGKTKLGRLWTYVRDDRPAADLAAPAVWFAYSPDRKGEHPHRHLTVFRGTLQADGYDGFNRLYDDGCIREAACWAHVRRSSLICTRRMLRLSRPKQSSASGNSMQSRTKSVAARRMSTQRACTSFINGAARMV